MFTTLAYAFLVLSGTYMTVYHRRRRNLIDKARIATGVQAAATVIWLCLFVSRVA